MARPFRVSLVLVALAIFTTFGVSAGATGPDALTYSSITVGCSVATVPPVAGQVVVPITAENVTGDGVVGFQLNVSYDHTALSFVSIANGASMSALGCGFATSKIGTVGNADLISGTCTTSIPRPGVTGASVELARITLTIPAAPFQVSLLQNPTGGYATGLIGPNADTPPTGGILYPATPSQLLACTPTAVTMAGFGASSDSPAAAVSSLWPALVAGAVVVAGGAYALSRRKR